MATISNPVTSECILDCDFIHGLVLPHGSLSTEFTETRDEGGSASGCDSSFSESSDQGGCYSGDSDNSSQLSSSPSELEQNSGTVMDQGVGGISEGIGSDDTDRSEATTGNDGKATTPNEMVGTGQLVTTAGVLTAYMNKLQKLW